MSPSSKKIFNLLIPPHSLIGIVLYCVARVERVSLRCEFTGPRLWIDDACGKQGRKEASSRAGGGGPAGRRVPPITNVGKRRAALRSAVAPILAFVKVAVRWILPIWSSVFEGECNSVIAVSRNRDDVVFWDKKYKLCASWRRKWWRRRTFQSFSEIVNFKFVASHRLDLLFECVIVVVVVVVHRRIKMAKNMKIFVAFLTFSITGERDLQFIN